MPAARPYDLLGIGDPVLDVIVQAEQLPGWDDKVLGQSLTLAAGGCEANVVCAASRLGLRTALLGTIGSDHGGTLLRRELARCGVDLQHLSEHPQGCTATALVQLSPQGERAITYIPAPAAADTVAHAALMAQSRCVYTLPYDAERLDQLARNARAGGCLLAVDVERAVAAAPRVAPLVARHADIVFFNHQGFHRSTGRSASAEALRDWLQGARAQLVVVTRGARGAIGLARTPQGQQSAEQPAFAARVRDTTGAGDTFNAACLSAWLNGRPLADALAEGCAAACLRVEGARGRDGWLSAELVAQVRQQRATLPPDARERP